MHEDDQILTHLTLLAWEKKRNNENWFKVRQPATRMPLNFHKVFCFSLLISTWKVSNLNQRELSFLREILGFNSTEEKTESMINYMDILKTLIQRMKTLSLPLPLSRSQKASHLVKFWLGVWKYLTSWRSNHVLTWLKRVPSQVFTSEHVLLCPTNQNRYCNGPVQSRSLRQACTAKKAWGPCHLRPQCYSY